LAVEKDDRTAEDIRVHRPEFWRKAEKQENAVKTAVNG
jgi:hypothetical protein